jgi:hypothetical protein
MNSFQQPIDSQPSVGTLHKITLQNIVNAVSPANTGVQTVDISSYVPVGCTLVLITALSTNAGTGQYNVRIYETNGSDIYNYTAINGGEADLRVGSTGPAPIDSSRVLRWAVSNTNLDDVTIHLIGYYL